MALHPDNWNVEYRPGGWIRLREKSGDGPTVFLQYRLAGPPKSQRLDLQTILMQAGGEESVSGRTWRRLPTTTIESSLNVVSILLPNNPPPEPKGIGEAAARFRDTFFDFSDETPTLDALDAYFDQSEPVFTPGELESDMLISDGLGDMPAGRVPRIKPPEGRITDEFLQDVAEAYRWLASANRPPAPGIAELSGAPVRTVHRWVYEARKRGILPPAKVGRSA